MSEQRQQDGLPRVAAVIAAVSWGLALCGAGMLLRTRAEVDEGLLFLLVDVTVALVYGTVAAVILSRRRHVVGWLLALAAVGGGLAAFGAGYERLATVYGALPAADTIGGLQGTAWVPGTLSLFLVVPWLVRDHPLGAARLGLAAGVVTTAVFSAASLLDLAYDVRLLTVPVVLVGLLAAGEAEWRHRRGPVEERNGLGWLALGTAVLALSFVPFLFPFGALPLPYWTTPVMHLASQAVYPAAVLTAVLRGRMWGLGLAVSRAVLAGLLAVLLLAGYLVTVLVLSRWIPAQGVAQLVGAGLVAVAVQPARLWLGRRVDRLVYGDAADPARLVRRLGTQLSVDDPDRLLEGLVADLGTAMRLESVRLEAPGLPPVGWGATAAAPVDVPLLHRGVQVGTLLVTVPAGEALGTRDQATLRDLSAVLATAVAVTLAGHEVAAVRERLARARLEERRLIRREVHDGLGPSLAGLRLGLQGARNLLAADPPDPAGAGDLLAELQVELDRRVDDVRTLSHHLLPPVLDELGLPAALEELAGRHREQGLEVTLSTGPVEALRPDLAAAAYGIAVEAMTNVARHSGARSCRLSATVDGDALVLEVVDDGTGMAAGARPGVGTRSMRERAEDLAGTVEVGGRPGGGTVVRARLPLEVRARV